MDVLLGNIEAGPEGLLLVHLPVYFLEYGFSFVESPQFVIGVAERAWQRRNFQNANLAYLLAQTFATKLTVKALFVRVVKDLSADHAGIEILGLCAPLVSRYCQWLLRPVVLYIVVH